MSAGRGVVAGLAATTLAACALALTAPAAASALSSGTAVPGAVLAHAAAADRWVCHGPAYVFDTPGEIVIGILARGDHVDVLLHAAGDSQWVLVRAPIDIRGWMKEGALCS